MNRAFVALVLAGAFAAGFVTLRQGPAHPVCAMADDVHHVAVVARHRDGQSVSRCVAFPGSSITAEQALDGSGLAHAYYDFGGSLGRGVCQVDGEPLTPPGGFNRSNCLYNSGGFWTVLVARHGGSWSATPSGVSNTAMVDGDAAGFAYGDGSEAPPPSPAGVCPVVHSPHPSITPRASPVVAAVRHTALPLPAAPVAAGTSGPPTAVIAAEPTAQPQPVDPSSRNKVAVTAGRTATPQVGHGWPWGWIAAGVVSGGLALLLVAQLALPSRRR